MKHGTLTKSTAQKHTPGFALDALLKDLDMWSSTAHGSRTLHFDALSSHPETDEDCTIADLIEPARAEFEGLKQWGVASTDQELHERAEEMLDTLKQVLAILNQPWKDCDGPKTLQIAKADCEIARRLIEATISKPIV